MRSLDVPFTSLDMLSMSGWRGLPDNPNTYTTGKGGAVYITVLESPYLFFKFTCM